jgi:hypothetical protein
MTGVGGAPWKGGRWGRASSASCRSSKRARRSRSTSWRPQKTRPEVAFHLEATAGVWQSDQAAAVACGNRPATASSTQMSSSSVSQRSARPPTRSRTCSSSSCGAWASSGNLLAGKLTTRWSVSSSHTRRPSIQQRLATALESASMELTISSDQRLAMVLHMAPNLVQFRSRKPVIGGECDGIEPEFNLVVVARDVDVGRLAVFSAVKMEPVRTDSEDGRHGVMH